VEEREGRGRTRTEIEGRVPPLLKSGVFIYATVANRPVTV